MHLRSRHPLASLFGTAVLAFLLAPLAAGAATVPVKPGGLQAAVDGAAPGDTLVLAAGDYDDTATVDKARLTLDGSAGARLLGPIGVDAEGTKFLAVAFAPKAEGLTVGRSGEATLERVVATRGEGGDVPVIDSAGTLALTDSTVMSGTGDALALGGAGTRIVRSSVITTEPGSDAVAFGTGSGGAKAVTADSSLLLGGATGGAGLRAQTSGGAPILAPVGDVTVSLRHVTIAGAKNGVVVASGAVAGGAVTATAAGSIVHPESTQSGGATFTATDSDGPGLQQNTPAEELFGARYRLRAGSPAIGKGGPLADGESRTDLAGVARPASGTDMGAYQFVNAPPTTGLTLSAGVVDEGATVTAVLTPGALAPGDKVSVYAFDWGDGSRVQTSPTPSASHRYTKPGVYKVTGAIADGRGVASAPATATVTVRDITAPVVKITSPKANARIKFKRSRRLVLRGTDADSTGVSKVEVALTRHAAKGRRTAQRKRCFQYRRGFKRGRCSALRFNRAKLSGQRWSLRLRRGAVLERGTYTLRVRAQDGVGNKTAKPTRRNGLLRKFVVR